MSRYIDVYQYEDRHEAEYDRASRSGFRMRPPRNLYYGWVLVMALGLTTIISYGTSQYLFGVLVVPMGRDLGWQRADLSGAYALNTLVAGLLGVPIGRLVDRHGAGWRSPPARRWPAAACLACPPSTRSGSSICYGQAGWALPER